MYTPTQPDHLLSQKFPEKVKYSETIIPELSDVLVCIWEQEYYSVVDTAYLETYLPDGCISLVVSIREKSIIWGGFSKTYFDMELPVSEKYLAFKFRPGAFYAMTGVDTSVVMDIMTPINEIDRNFDIINFFELGYEQMKQFLIDYFIQLAGKVKKREYIDLFDKINNNHIQNTEELYDFIKLSPRQIQRQFKKHYGLKPQMVLSIIKFQHCVAELMSQRSERTSLMNHYYDQSKFINEFQKYLGVTPVQFVNLTKVRKTSL